MQVYIFLMIRVGVGIRVFNKIQILLIFLGLRVRKKEGLA